MFLELQIQGNPVSGGQIASPIGKRCPSGLKKNLLCVLPQVVINTVSVISNQHAYSSKMTTSALKRPLK